LKGYSVWLLSSFHDDGVHLTQKNQNYRAGTKLLLSGVAQVYYGDESARSLVIEGTQVMRYRSL
jgi:alpha-amylase